MSEACCRRVKLVESALTVTIFCLRVISAALDFVLHPFSSWTMHGLYLHCLGLYSQSADFGWNSFPVTSFSFVFIHPAAGFGWSSFAMEGVAPRKWMPPLF